MSWSGLVRERIAGLTAFLAEDAVLLGEQRHLNAGSPERIYWHHGYLMALRDVHALAVKANHQTPRKRDTPS